MTLATFAGGHLDWIGRGLRAAAAMLWMTWWPLILGFALSGCVQSFVRRDGLRTSLGRRGPVGAVRATTLGMISSSCSYAASAMARSLFARGSSWTNSMIFMIASTNLVIELGVVLYLLLGWQFVVAEFVGGALMIAMLAVLLPRVFSSDRESHLHERVAGATGDGEGLVGDTASVRTMTGWSRAARFAGGDLNMLKKELVLGFLVAGFLAADVPTSWWQKMFVTGHGPWTLIENVVVAPLLAVVSFVCSVGNIPLAAALWSGGVAFGGVIAFIFADLITLPLLLIYRRFYGTGNARRLFFVFWATMSAAGLIVDLLFRSLGLIPPRHEANFVSGTFDMGWTLVLNIAATVVVVIGVWLIRRGGPDEHTAIDPVCGMQVERASAAATFEYRGQRFYFCAPRCADKFAAEPDRYLTATTIEMKEDLEGDSIDPVCQMRVSSADPAAKADVGGIAYYFCSSGCRDTFLANPAAPNPQTKIVSLGRKPPRE